MQSLITCANISTSRHIPCAVKFNYCTRDKCCNANGLPSLNFFWSNYSANAGETFTAASCQSATDMYLARTNHCLHTCAYLRPVMAAYLRTMDDWSWLLTESQFPTISEQFIAFVLLQICLIQRHDCPCTWTTLSCMSTTGPPSTLIWKSCLDLTSYFLNLQNLHQS